MRKNSVVGTIFGWKRTTSWVALDWFRILEVTVTVKEYTRGAFLFLRRPVGQKSWHVHRPRRGKTTTNGSDLEAVIVMFVWVLYVRDSWQKYTCSIFPAGGHPRYRKKKSGAGTAIKFSFVQLLVLLISTGPEKKEKEDIVISQNERALLDCSDAFCFVAKQGVKRLNPNWTEREIRMPVLNQDVVAPSQQQCGLGANQVTHVIFDVDGTLLDTGPLYNKAITKVWNHHSLISALFVQTSRQ